MDYKNEKKEQKKDGEEYLVDAEAILVGAGMTSDEAHNFVYSIKDDDHYDFKRKSVWDPLRLGKYAEGAKRFVEYNDKYGNKSNPGWKKAKDIDYGTLGLALSEIREYKIEYNKEYEKYKKR